MVSGQAPTLATQADCPLYADVLPGLPNADGQVIGQGCVYPAAVKTVADQLDAAGLTWRGYMEDMGNDPARDNGATCAHPVPGTPDGTQQATATDQYATRHNPFVYFHSIVDDAARCAAGDVPLSRLPADLASAAATPNLAFITPDLCHDGHDADCADGGAGGLSAADAFLRTWVPRITGSPAYQRDGALVIAFDESAGDSSACCGEQSGPNTPAAGGQSGGPGGGRTGAVILAPSIPGGTVITQPYNHYGLLRGIEDAFGLPHLGYAATTEGIWP
jgi:phosphatidylinositol-3-phosphatase